MGKLVEKAQLNNVHAWVEQQGLSVELRRHFPAVTGKAVDHLLLQRAVELRPQHTSQEEEEGENTQHGPPEYTAHRFPGRLYWPARPVVPSLLFRFHVRPSELAGFHLGCDQCERIRRRPSRPPGLDHASISWIVRL